MGNEYEKHDNPTGSRHGFLLVQGIREIFNTASIQKIIEGQLRQCEHVSNGWEQTN